MTCCPLHPLPPPARERTCGAGLVTGDAGGGTVVVFVSFVGGDGGGSGVGEAGTTTNPFCARASQRVCGGGEGGPLSPQPECRWEEVGVASKTPGSLPESYPRRGPGRRLCPWRLCVKEEGGDTGGGCCGALCVKRWRSGSWGRGDRRRCGSHREPPAGICSRGCTAPYPRLTTLFRYGSGTGSFGYGYPRSAGLEKGEASVSPGGAQV